MIFKINLLLLKIVLTCPKFLQKKQITDMKMNFTTNNIMPLINMGMTMNTNTGGCITLW